MVPWSCLQGTGSAVSIRSSRRAKRARMKWGAATGLGALLAVTPVALLTVPASALSNWDNVIVKQAQNPSDPTSWLVVGGKRYWIPTGAVFNCLRASGAAGPVLLSIADLNVRPDQNGQHADCGAGNDPRGSLDDAASNTAGTVDVRGWATDRNVRTVSVDIHVYIGGPAGSSAAEGHDIGNTSVYRPDVNNVYPGDGNYHGFDTRIATAKVGSQPVCVYAINLGPGANVLLSCRTVAIDSGSPRGSLDAATGTPSGGVHLGGWATDPSVRANSLDIHVYIGGPAGSSGAEGHDIGLATGYRPDVNAVYPGDGNYHGFDTEVSSSKRGTQQVCVYAINQGPGQNSLLGCRSVFLYVDPYLLPSPFAPNTYAYPLNQGVCALVDQTGSPNNEIYENFVLKGFTATSQQVTCTWWATTQADEHGLLGGIIVSLAGSLSPQAACKWMTGEGYVYLGGEVRCLWTKAYAPTERIDGTYH